MKLHSTIKYPVAIAGTAIGLSLIGDKLNSPSLSSAGSVTSGFIGPAVNITMGGYMIRQLKGLKTKNGL